MMTRTLLALLIVVALTGAAQKKDPMPKDLKQAIKWHYAKHKAKFKAINTPSERANAMREAAGDLESLAHAIDNGAYKETHKDTVANAATLLTLEFNQFKKSEQ